MSNFIKYQDCPFRLNQTGIFASSVELSVSVDAMAVKTIDGDISYTRTYDFTNRSYPFNETDEYSINGPIKGSLNLEYYLDDDFDHYIDPLTISESPMIGNLAGVEINNMYLNSFEFSVSPFSRIPIRLGFDIYGSIFADNLGDSNPSIGSTDISILNGALSYIKGTNIDNKIDHITNFTYSVNLKRSPYFYIGSSLPNRVSIDSTEINVSIDAEKFGDYLTIDKNKAEIEIGLKSLYNKDVTKVIGCTGIITSNGLSVSEQNNLAGKLSIFQSYI
jgi:hypothetical protein